MIKEIVTMLSAVEHDGITENIDIARGLYKLPDSISEAWKQHKLKKKWQ